MRSARRIALLAIVAARAEGVGAQRIEVGGNVQVSAALPGEPQAEVILAADPANPDRLMACSMLLPLGNPSFAETVTYNSFDGGRSWGLTLRVRGEQETWDPDCAYGLDGEAYSVSEVMDSAQQSHIRIDRSSDGGHTWRLSRRVEHFERAFLTIDRTTGPRRGWLYLHGQGGARTMGGARDYVGGLGMHILLPTGEVRTLDLLSGGESFVITTGPGVVLSDGTFVGVFSEIKDYWDSDGTGRIPPNLLGLDGRANAWVKVARLEAGEHAPAVVTVADEFSAWGGAELVSSSSIPSLAADPSDGPFGDRLYAGWIDFRSGRGEVLLSYSSDGGTTWSAPRAVNDDRPPRAPLRGADHLMPVVAVNLAGVVGVMWYDRRGRPDGLGWEVRFRASLDGGETFLPSVRVSERPHAPWAPKRWHLQALTRPAAALGPVVSTIGVHHFDFTGGHTAGLAADARGAFHPLWVSNATGLDQLWTAAVRVEGSATRHGDSTLALLTDVTRSLRLEFTHRVYDRGKALLEVDLALRNGSPDTIAGPVSVRLLDLRSELGAVSLLGADNGRLGPGAVWRFTDEIETGVLRPGQVSRPKRLRFRVTELDTVSHPTSAIVGMVVAHTRMFATSVAKAGEPAP